MTDTGTICDLIEGSQAAQVEGTPSARKLHWSDILVAGLGLTFLIAVSLHASPAQSQQESQPTVLKWVQEG